MRFLSARSLEDSIADGPRSHASEPPVHREGLAVGHPGDDVRHESHALLVWRYVAVELREGPFRLVAESSRQHMTFLGVLYLLKVGRAVLRERACVFRSTWARVPARRDHAFR